MLISRWFVAFLFTQAVEVPLYRRFARATFLEAFGASAFTHPIVWFVIPGLWEHLYLGWLERNPGLALGRGARYAAYLVIAEGFAVLAEAAYLRLLRRKRPLLVSLGANAASATSWLVLQAIFGPF